MCIGRIFFFKIGSRIATRYFPPESKSACILLIIIINFGGTYLVAILLPILKKIVLPIPMHGQVMDTACLDIGVE